MQDPTLNSKDRLFFVEYVEMCFLHHPIRIQQKTAMRFMFFLREKEHKNLSYIP